MPKVTNCALKDENGQPECSKEPHKKCSPTNDHHHHNSLDGIKGNADKICQTTGKRRNRDDSRGETKCALKNKRQYDQYDEDGKKCVFRASPYHENPEQTPCKTKGYIERVTLGKKSNVDLAHFLFDPSASKSECLNCKPFLFAINPMTMKYKAIILDGKNFLESESQSRFQPPPKPTHHHHHRHHHTPPPPKHQRRPKPRSPPKVQTQSPGPKVTVRKPISATSANKTATPRSSMAAKSPSTSVPKTSKTSTTTAATRKVSSKPTSSKPSATPPPPPPPAKASPPKESPPKTDLIESEFSKIVQNYHPLIWVFGYSQVAMMEQKQKCLEVLANKNKLTIINLDDELRRWNDTSPLKNPPNNKNLSELILSRAKKLSHRVIREKGLLSTKEICQLIKYAMLTSATDQGDNCKGFIVDNFPLSMAEGIESEEVLYKSAVCLYFISSDAPRKTKDPHRIHRAKYHMRTTPYAEKNVQETADYFGFKTIKILNTEDLKDVQIEDIATLVQTHLEGNGLALHKIMTNEQREMDKGKTKGMNTANRPKISEEFILDHNDFVNAKKGNAKAMGKKAKVFEALKNREEEENNGGKVERKESEGEESNM